jgi:spore coat protein U-like protein
MQRSNAMSDREAQVSERLCRGQIHRFARIFMASAWVVVLAPQVHAACTITATGVNFGPYNVFSTVNNDNGVGTLTIVCGGGAGNNYPVSLSTGQSLSYANRVMNSGANLLNYNLYTTIGRNTIWGDGTGGSGVITVLKNATTNLSVYGRIPWGQDAAVGNYSENITATVTF